MEMYTLGAFDESLVAKVGWDQTIGSYFALVFRRGPFGETEVEDPEVILTVGEDPWHKITNVGELLWWTWDEIDWESPEGVRAARALRDSPIADWLWFSDVTSPTELDDYVTYVFNPRHIADDIDQVPLRPNAHVRREPLRIKQTAQQQPVTMTQRLWSSISRKQDKVVEIQVPWYDLEPDEMAKYEHLITADDLETPEAEAAFRRNWGIADDDAQG